MGVLRKHSLHEMVGIARETPIVYVAGGPEDVHVCLFEGNWSWRGGNWALLTIFLYDICIL